MKFTALTTGAMLVLASSVLPDTTTAESLSRSVSRRVCNYECPSNSRRKPHRRCYDSFNDCACEKGYYEKDDYCVKDLSMTVNNLSFRQPFSSFFVMVHSNKAPRLYRQGQMASKELAILAEDGNPDALVDRFAHTRGVLKSFRVNGPVPPGGNLTIQVQVNDDYNRVTIATMAINTNDCFASVNGAELQSGTVLNLPGLDAGSEENNELCTSIPGPGCLPESGNVRSGNGEGYVHVHRGFRGVNEGKGDQLEVNDLGANGKPLAAASYDWRNPIMRVTVA